MSRTIHYFGRITDLALLGDLQEEFSEIAAVSGWNHERVNQVFPLDGEPCDRRQSLKGIRLNISKTAGSVQFTFDSDGCLAHIYSEWEDVVPLAEATQRVLSPEGPHSPVEAASPAGVQGEDLTPSDRVENADVGRSALSHRTVRPYKPSGLAEGTAPVKTPRKNAARKMRRVIHHVHAKTVLREGEADPHRTLVHLLDYLRKKYVPNLEVIDSTGYWLTRDDRVLEFRPMELAPP
jgi:hypothetical protein